jgi:hypothetical protein
MGWLDNSTNNIILDAVLTDYGRSRLAASNSSNGGFHIAKFALSDDEVDYSIIQKYGRTVGKEKIEKNTPVFEAFTNQNLAIKYKLISVNEPLVYLPQLKVSPTGTISIATQAANTTQLRTTATVIVTQTPTGGTIINPSLSEVAFDVYVPSLFLQITAGTSTNVQSSTANGNPNSNGMVLYRVAAVGNTADNSRNISFNILAAAGLTSSQFNVYGTSSTGGSKIINTFIKVVGTSSGAVVNIPVSITGQGTQ